MKEWRKENPEKIKNYNKKDYQKHKEAYKERAKQWAKNNRERCNELSRLSYQRNKEKHQKLCKRWKQENKDKCNNYQKKYVKNNPKIIIAQRIASKIPLKKKCEICGSINKLQRHHWNYDKPLLVNTLCQECHIIQHV